MKRIVLLLALVLLPHSLTYAYDPDYSYMGTPNTVRGYRDDAKPTINPGRVDFDKFFCEISGRDLVDKKYITFHYPLIKFDKPEIINALREENIPEDAIEKLVNSQPIVRKLEKDAPIRVNDITIRLAICKLDLEPIDHYLETETTHCFSGVCGTIYGEIHYDNLEIYNKDYPGDVYKTFKSPYGGEFAYVITEKEIVEIDE